MHLTEKIYQKCYTAKLNKIRKNNKVKLTNDITSRERMGTN